MSVISHSVIVTVVSPFHVSPFRYSMCRRFGYICVAVLVCRRFDQLPVILPKKYKKNQHDTRRKYGALQHNHGPWDAYYGWTTTRRSLMANPPRQRRDPEYILNITYHKSALRLTVREHLCTIYQKRPPNLTLRGSQHKGCRPC